MAGKVDVLAVLDTACRLHEEGAHGDAWEAEFSAVYEARAAVAELIHRGQEAADLIKAQADFLDELRTSGHIPSSLGDLAVQLIHRRNGLVESGAFNSKPPYGGRFTSALARVSGGA